MIICLNDPSKVMNAAFHLSSSYIYILLKLYLKSNFVNILEMNHTYQIIHNSIEDETERELGRSSGKRSKCYTDLGFNR